MPANEFEHDVQSQQGSEDAAAQDWEADARAQIAALLGAGVEDVEEDEEDDETPDLDALRQAIGADESTRQSAVETHTAEGEEKGQDEKRWYDTARQRVASLLGRGDDLDELLTEPSIESEAEPIHQTNGARLEEAEAEAASAEPDALQEETAPSSPKQVSTDWRLNWLVDFISEEEDAEASEGFPDVQTDADAAAEEVPASSAAAEQEETDVFGEAAEVEEEEGAYVSEEVPAEQVGAAADQEEDEVAATDEAASDEVAKAEADAKVEQPAQRTALDDAMLAELYELIQDDVVIDVLKAGAVELSQVVEAVKRQRQQPAPSLWRHLVELEGVDRDTVFAAAARLHDYEAVKITDERPTTAFLPTILGVYTPTVREQFVELNLLPFAFEAEMDDGKQGFLVATHDPTHPEVQTLAAALEPAIRLHYAPEAVVTERVPEIAAFDPSAGGADGDGILDTEEVEDELQAPVAPEESDADAQVLEESVDEEERLIEQSESDAAGSEEPPGARADAEERDGIVEEQENVHTEHLEQEEPLAEEQLANEAIVGADEIGGAEVVEDSEAADSAAGEADVLDTVADAEEDAASQEDHSEQEAEDEQQEDEAWNLAPSTDTAGHDLPPEELARMVQSDGMVDEVDVLEATDPASQPEPISGDGYGDLDVPLAQQGQELEDDLVDLPEEPPLPPDLTEWEGQNGSKKTQAVVQADSDTPATNDRVVAILLHKGIVDATQVAKAQREREQTQSRETLWRTLTQITGVDRETIFAEAAQLYAFPAIPEHAERPDPDFARSVMNTFGETERDKLIQLRVLPYECDMEEQTGTVRLAFITHDPTRPEVHRVMKKLHLERFELMYAPETVVMAALAEAFPRKNEYLERINEDDQAVDLGMVYEEEGDLIDEDALEAEISRSTLINLFEASLIEAVRQGASDIHIYPNARKQIEIHFRVDGRLKHWHTEEKVHPEALLAVIKDNAVNVDRFERDAAQDGFIQRWVDDALIRFRVSVLPIANASQEIRSESIVIRVLDDRKVMTDLSKLGLLEGALERFDHAIRQPHGMVILTGPTGSGKSTTLVASLHQVVTPEVNVLTVEDPVEYIIPGVRQIKLNHKLGLEAALRSILRHDPDVVMVGEMRDRKTAELAIKLANTGHLTFSTLHTNDAPSAISRLYKMGIEPFLIAYAINLVVAQRLIRAICPACKQEDPDPDPIMLQQLGFSEEEIQNTTFYMPGSDKNCPTCRGLGYKGRRAISEALYFSRPIRHMIVEADGMIDEQAIRKLAESEGMLSLQASAREVVKMGETSTREMMRVVSTGE